MALRFKSGLIVFALATLGCASIGFGQTVQQNPLPGSKDQEVGHPTAQQGPDQQLPGSISGTVVDRTGAVVAGARVSLTREDHSPAQQVVTGQDGQFSFANIASGPFQLTITCAGFATHAASGMLHSGEIYTSPPIALAVATAITDVEVVLSPEEVAEEQIKDQEKQRVLGVIPNFYVTYVPDPVPLTARQKFGLAWKTTIDPVTLVLNGGVAGVQQATDEFSGYGQGAQGYAKRFGASYADTVSSTFIGGAILPSLLKQDPRYFYKGTGSARSRLLYAIANSVICKGDNRRWQVNYSGILGALASGGLSNLYYPSTDRDGLGLTFENALIGIGQGAAANILQEFVIKKLTPKLPNQGPPKPQSGVATGSGVVSGVK
ncbi:MAG: carboxypeptidase-like regulatory domain-containing protein [Terriglobales bacterium]